MSTLREELQSVYDQYGKLTPVIVLEVARDPENPLHSRFNWDDSEAAEMYRLSQAHELIQRVKIRYRKSPHSQERSVRAWQYIPSDNVYEPTEKVVADPVLTEIVLRTMEREWKQLKQRYSTFNEFWMMVASDAEFRKAG